MNFDRVKFQRNAAYSILSSVCRNDSLRQEISQQTNNRPGPINYALLLCKIKLNGMFNTHELVLVQFPMTNRFQELNIHCRGCNEKRCMMAANQKYLPVSRQSVLRKTSSLRLD